MAQPVATAELAVVKTWLVDTGPLVAHLDGADRAHPEVTERLDDFAGALVTSSAVATEAMHVLGARRGGPRLLAELVQATGMTVHDLSRPPELFDVVGLMETYHDTPMDYADGTLVLLAEALNIREVLSLDRRGFSTYRTRQRRSLRLVLDMP